MTLIIRTGPDYEYERGLIKKSGMDRPEHVFCADCRHMDRGAGGMMCGRPKRKDKVTGKSLVISCEEARKVLFERRMSHGNVSHMKRPLDVYCGELGVYWEPVP